MNSIVVFCGSSAGNDPQFVKLAYDLGKQLASKQIKLVYGGAKIGLMGSVANGCLDNGGKVIGIIPEFLKTKEVVHEQLSQLIITETMHERKRLMSQKSEGCIALPGGFGTLEELFELLTDAQLGHYNYPIGLLNINGYYDNLVILLGEMVTKGLLKEDNFNLLIIDNNILSLLEKMKAFIPTYNPKWIK